MSAYHPLRTFAEPAIVSPMAHTGFDALMHEACVVWGFCGCIKHDQRLHVTLLIPPEGPVTADQFVEWLFLADNLNPNSERPEQWQRQKEALRSAFARHMGGETVDARLLHWSDVPPTDDGAAEKYRDKLPDVS